MKTIKNINNFDNRMFVAAWRQTGIKDNITGRILLTRVERLHVIKIKMNRLYNFIAQSIKKQIAV